MGQIGESFIDSLQFAREKRRMAGELPVSSMSRLSDILAEDCGTLSWVVSGDCGDDHKPFLVLEVAGELQLKCQRCLGALQHGLKIKSRLQLVPRGAPWPDEDLEDDRSDPIEAMEDQSVLQLVEDEVLLALPIAPRHQSCMMPGIDDESVVASPFAALRTLKKH